MYLVLIYIIIVFILLICHRQIVEGQNNDEVDEDKDLEDKYEERYGERLEVSDIRKRQINIVLNHNISNEIKLTVYLVDKVSEIKKILNNNDRINIPLERIELIYKNFVLRDSYSLFEYGMDEDDIIDIGDSIKIISEYGLRKSRLFDKLYDDDEDNIYHIDPYERYLTDFLKYNKLKKVKSDKIYSQKISNLFKRRSKPLLKSYNQSQYLDDDLNEKIRKANLDESNNNDLLGPSPYIESSELFDRILQGNNDNNSGDDKSKDNDKDNDKGKKICCDRTSLNIENPKLIDGKYINMFRHDLIYESSKHTFESTNSSYYDYMETGNKTYEYLYGRMDNNKSPGELSL